MNFEALTDPKIIVGIISILVGGFIALRNYNITKRRKDFDTANQIRKLLQDLLSLERKIADEVSSLGSQFIQKTSHSEFKNIKSTPSLLITIEEKGLNETSDTEVNELITKAYNLHSQYIEIRNLNTYSLRDLVDVHHKVLGNYEKTLVYKRIINSERDYKNWEKWYNRITNFYNQLRRQRDYSNQMRLGFSLIEAEIKYGKLATAKRHSEDISQSEFIDKVTITPVIVKLQIERLKQQLNKQGQEQE